MVDAQEAEIRRQFLEEAQEYLSEIEEFLLAFPTQSTSGQVDAALRAAHSIKGGAAMMGFQTLSELAHRYEDSLKVIRAQQATLSADLELEQLLLAGLDCLRQVAAFDRQELAIDEDWLTHHASPVFEQLRQRLGEPTNQPMMLDDPDIGMEDMAALLFESEVEAHLSQIEALLANVNAKDQAADLRSAMQTATLELGGLGEMLELPAFTNLCQTIAKTLDHHPAQTVEITQAALQAWRHAQALVLVGQVDLLPTGIAWASQLPSPLQAPVDETPDDADLSDVAPVDIKPLTDTAVDLDQVSEPIAAHAMASHLAPDLALPVDESLMALATDLELASDLEFVGYPPQATALTTDDWSLDSDNILMPHDLPDVAPSGSMASPELRPLASSTEQGSEQHKSPTAGVGNPESRSVRSITLGDEVPYPTAEQTPQKPSSVPQQFNPAPSVTRQTPTPITGMTDSTVRVPVRQLDQLNDLFGELTIERNGLRLTLARMRELMRSLVVRMRGLEQANTLLRANYDRASTGFGLAYPLALPPRGMVSPTAVDSSMSEPHLTDGMTRDGTDGARNDPSTLRNGHTGEHSTLDMSNFDVLEMDRYSELHLLSQNVMETIVQVQEVTGDLELNLEETDQLVRDLNRTARQLQTGLTQVRMRPLSDVVGRFPRALRELSLQHRKPVELVVYGGGTLIERAILEALSDPLMHLLRNCFDHGIEPPEVRQAAGKPEKGTIEIRAAYRGNRTIITMSDDGGGINLAKVRAKAEGLGFDPVMLATASDRDLLELIFAPGFSTADQVTTLSGRGVGMDVVRTNLQRVQGDIRVDSQLGVGTSFTISVPFTLSVVRVLLVESMGMMLAFPKDVIEELILLQPSEVLHTVSGEVLDWDGAMVPLLRLDRQFQFNCPSRPLDLDDTPVINQPTVLIISQDQDLVGIAVDRCWGEQEVAIRQVESKLPLPQGFAGCAILGDGRVVPLVDTTQLLAQMPPVSVPEPMLGEQPRASTELQPVSATPAAVHSDRNHLTRKHAAQEHTVLVVDDSVNVRRYLALALEKAGFRVEQAKDGQDALDKLTSGLQVQAVVCDIEMPRLDGYGLLARIKSDPMLHHLPVTMLTSRIGDKHRRLGMSLGAAAYFSKPYQEQDLLKTLNQLITNKGTPVQ